MNEAHKKSLHANHKKLLEDLDLSPDEYGELIHSGVLNEDMIDEIKAGKTRKERVQKLLMILPRRGPRAFDKFVCAIQNHYPWLAENLRKTHHKISLHTEPEMLSLKKKVDIYVHEKFGNSKRLCEDDKKEIRHFLYSHLKSHKEEDDPLFAVEQSRRNSLESNASDIGKFKAVSDQDILIRVYSMLDSNNNVSNSGEFDDVDGHAEVTMDMIEKKVKEMNGKVESLQNELNNCYTALGVGKTEQPLHEVLENIRDDRIVERRRFVRLREKLEALEQERIAVEEKIVNQKKDWEVRIMEKEEELKRTKKKLSDVEHQNEKSEAQIRELKHKCEKLEHIHLKHIEKQQTLMTLKSMVSELSPSSKTDAGWFKSTNDKKEPFLPKLSPVRVNRQGRHSHAGNQDKPAASHHEFPRPRASHHGLPWK